MYALYHRDTYTAVIFFLEVEQLHNIIIIYYYADGGDAMSTDH